MEKTISYLNRTFDDYRQALIEYSKKYYPELATSFDDSSVGSWLIDLNSEIGDNLSYHIDRVFQETNINSANEKSSVYAIARNSGLKIPGPKGAMAEVRFTCNLPMTKEGDPNWDYAPVIKRGTRVSSSNQSFELLEDVNFAEQFNNDGISDRTYRKVVNSNNQNEYYIISKLATVVAGETKIYKKEIYNKDIKPFMEILIPTENVMNIESIIMKDGNSLQNVPSYGEFNIPEETSDVYKSTTRFFEVDYLAQQNRWGEICEEDIPVKADYYYKEDETLIPTYRITRGEWKPITHKFITEYTDGGYLKIIFGSGEDSGQNVDLSSGSDYARYQISKIIKNNFLGVLPEAGTTLFILYRVGGGSASNVAKGAINTISTLRIEMPCTTEASSTSIKESVRRSVKVENTTPSVSGKDMPTVNELKYLIKYNSGEQERCVTVKDYISRVLKMPAKYGTPFRIGVSEENNKIMMYLLGVDYNGYLDATLPEALTTNIQNYLSEYRMLNDYVEIKSGRIINISFDINVVIDKNYNQVDVANTIKSVITDYLDINKHMMGDDIFVGDIMKEIVKTDGVINIASIRVLNQIGPGYSKTQIGQEIVSYSECDTADKLMYDSGEALVVDLDASDNTLYSDGDTMFELKYPDKDINIYCKSR